MILVTGGTGLVGSHLLIYLTQKYPRIRATFRTKQKIEAVKHVFSYYPDISESSFDKIEWVDASLNDIPKLTEAFRDVSKVYHCAALVSFDPNDYHELRNVNILGTANIVNLCIANGVDKLCYVSSVAALGGKDLKDPVTEDSPWNQEGDHHVYAITKYGAELEVWRGTQEGLNAVIVNPGIIVGPGFWRSSSGAIFKRVHKGLKYYTSGTSGYVDIHDVVKQMIMLMESEIKNERFVQVSENLSFMSFFQLLAKELKVDMPSKKVSPLMLQIGWRMDWLRTKLKRKKRRLTKHLAQSLTRDAVFNNSKIKNALHCEFKPIRQSVKETGALFLKDLV